MLEIRKKIVSGIMIVTFSIILGNCATDKQFKKLEKDWYKIKEKASYVSADYEELYGFWVNFEYNEDDSFAAIVIYNPDGTWINYTNESSRTPDWRGRYIITEKTFDDNGNIWYEFSVILDSWPPSLGNISPSIGQGRIKISNDLKTLKYYFPENMNRDLIERIVESLSIKIDPQDPYIRIYYRL
jgi:hypothetical protein